MYLKIRYAKGKMNCLFFKQYKNLKRLLEMLYNACIDSNFWNFFFFLIQTSSGIWLFPRVYTILLFHTNTPSNWTPMLRYDISMWSNGSADQVGSLACSHTAMELQYMSFAGTSCVVSFMEYIPNYFEWLSFRTRSLPLADLVWMPRLWL